MHNQPKKKLAARLYDAIFPPKQMKRSYAAAKASRLNAGWSMQPTGVNWETRVSLPALIARSRQAARDDLHIVNYLRLMRANVIGCEGIKLQSNARSPRGKLNVKLNQTVEEAWWKWSHAETCTVSGKLDWKGVQDLAVTQIERDGAFLIQMIEADNDFGFALKTWDVLWLDQTFSQILNNGNRIIMSVEIDVNDKPVAYYMTTPQTELNFTRDRTRVRIPAEQIIHGVLYHDDESQVHGIPGTVPALLPAKNAYSYNEGVVMQARVSANTFGVLKNTMPDGEAQFTGSEDSEGNARHPFIESSPLAITPLLPGWELQQLDPKQPTQNHSAFKKTLDMDIATGLGVPYFLLMGDWEAVNFSSSRGGLGEFRERCKAYQAFLAMTLSRRVFNAWLRQAWLKGALTLTPAEYEEVQNPAWQPRGFDYIDPTKDINADVTALENKLDTYTNILGRQGIDLPDHLAVLKAEQELAKSMGIDLAPVSSVKVTENAPPPADTTGGANADDTSGDNPPASRALTNGHNFEHIEQ
jgi:lambda family phage portal protein